MKLYIFLFTLISSLQLSLSQTKDSIIFINFSETKLEGCSRQIPIIDISAGNSFATYTTIDGAIHLITPEREEENVMFGTKKIKSSSTSLYHTTILFEDNTIDQCSFMSQYKMYVPTKLVNIESIDAGDLMSIGISKKSYMYVWGKGNIVSDLNLPLKTYGVRQASVGKEHIVFINIKDRVFVFSNDGLNQKMIPDVKAKPLKVAAGEYHSLLLDIKGNLHVWGDSNFNQTKIPDFGGKKVIDIDANGLLSLAILEDSSAVVWGANINTTFKLNELGKIKNIKLGKNFLMAHLKIDDRKKKKRIDFSPQRLKIPSIELDTNEVNYLTKKKLLDSLQFYALNSPFKTTKIDTKNNSYNYSNEGGVHKTINSSTNVIFQGSNNTINVVNKGGSTLRSNHHQTIIFKGSGHNKQLIYKGRNLNNSNIHDTVVIDLDNQEFGTDITPAYSDAYNNTEEQQMSESNYVEISEIPSSNIAFFPIDEEGFFINGDYYVPINEPDAMIEEIGYLEPGFGRAQVYFYLGKNKSAFQELKEACNPRWNASFTVMDAHLALFEIYYYGLFNTPTNLDLATKHYNMYLQIHNNISD